MNQNKAIIEVVFTNLMTKTSLELAINRNGFFNIVNKHEGNIIEINTPNPIPDIKETFTLFIKCGEDEFKKIEKGWSKMDNSGKIVKL